MSQQHSVHTHLGTAAADYDRAIRTWVPGYEQMLAAICWWLSKVIPERGRVVELGGGTGALSEAVLSKLSNVEIEIWDVDDDMLGVAQQRLRRFGERVTLRHESFTEPLEPCDAVIATLSLHHIPSLDAKCAVYQNIFNAICSGGIFLNGDCMLDANAPSYNTMIRYWLDFMAAHGISETEGRNNLAKWSKEDTFQQTLDELLILKKAGFDHPEIYWKQGPIAVYGGIKL
jgi:tRNA (cmo5U34)-methyltransferase